MINASLLALFVPTFFIVSVTPGMCMTLSLTLGMSIGLRRTFYMMWGELAGVALVSIAAVAGVATVMLRYPEAFTLLKYGGGGYLMYLGAQMWLCRGKMAFPDHTGTGLPVPPSELMMQGFITAIANPKGWAFMISLFPPFIDRQYPVIPQITILLSIILVIEFACLIIYASGGKRLRTFLSKRGGTQLLNRISGILMIAVGLWLALG
ncbi:LysE family translocator [Desulforhopalus sp. IMCC35007]|uniref:LysE family translocator n=1 Tax=Desulforhopalus sp. IMCC35007 TaxID=2569543 RepID=UPI001F10F626|nr:LysE family translocator [Desulforhopalus sp. IMCC35007]